MAFCCPVGKKSKPKPKVPPNVDDVASLLSEMSLTPTIETDASPLILEDSEETETAACLGRRDEMNDLPGILGASPPRVTVATRDSESSTTPVCIEDEVDRPDRFDGQCSSPASGNKQESSAASPNASSVVADLHLSSIDWEATSFSMSPQAESRTGGGQTVQAGEPVKATYNVCNPAQKTVGPNHDTLGAKSEPPVLALSDSPCITHLHKLPLRERLLIKNAAKCAPSELPNVLKKPFPLKPIPRSLNIGVAMKSSNNHNVNSKENLQNKSTKEQGFQKSEKQIHATRKPDPNARAPERPATKSFTFVKMVPPASVRALSDGNVTSKMVSESSTKVTQKKSVCHKVASSSEDEQETGGRPKPIFKKERAKSEMPGNKMAPVKPAANLQPVTFSIPSIQNILDDVFSSPEAKVLSAKSPVELSDDDDDSIISVDSPLPLSERLKLRLLQNS